MDNNSNDKYNNFNVNAKEFYPQFASSNNTNDNKQINGIPSQCVWVGNVSPNVSESEFLKEFEQFGRVVSLRLFPSSKCAFVTFESPSIALKSLALEGKMFNSMKLTLNVGMASRHLWVGNVIEEITEKDLKNLFRIVESIRVLRSNNSAFVNFISEEDAVSAASELNGYKLKDSKLLINFQWSDMFKKSIMNTSPSTKKTKKSNNKNEKNYLFPSRQLFVGNITKNVDEKFLYNLFGQFGEIEAIKSFPNRGYAFVVFTNINHSIWTREQMTMYPPVIDGQTLTVNYGKKSDNGVLSSNYPGPFYLLPVVPGVVHASEYESTSDETTDSDNVNGQNNKDDINQINEKIDENYSCEKERKLLEDFQLLEK